MKQAQAPTKLESMLKRTDGDNAPNSIRYNRCYALFYSE